VIPPDSHGNDGVCRHGEPYSCGKEAVMNEYEKVSTGIAILGIFGGILIGFSFGFLLGVYL
jgi:hypothetical protein